MARTCTICAHANRQEIDAALATKQTSNTALASIFDVTEAAIRRHAARHLPATLTKAQAAREVTQADNLLAQVSDLQQRTLAILTTAEEAGDLRVALGAIGQARANLELLARLLGELHEQEVNIGILVTSPDWLRLRSAILTALDSYPDARRAVTEAIIYVG